MFSPESDSGHRPHRLGTTDWKVVRGSEKYAFPDRGRDLILPILQLLAPPPLLLLLLKFYYDYY